MPRSTTIIPESAPMMLRTFGSCIGSSFCTFFTVVVIGTAVGGDDIHIVRGVLCPSGFSRSRSFRTVVLVFLVVVFGNVVEVKVIEGV